MSAADNRKQKGGLAWQTLGLAAFVFTAVGAVLVLLYDLWLNLTGAVMITEYCRSHPWAAWVILVMLQIGVMGLAVHFMAPVEK